MTDGELFCRIWEVLQGILEELSSNSERTLRSSVETLRMPQDYSRETHNRKDVVGGAQRRVIHEHIKKCEALGNII